MKRQIIISVIMLLLLTVSHLVSAQEDITIVAPTSEVAEDLDLHAVAELFKDSKNLEEFEKALNDPEIGINNLDLDGDGYVDYIRVVEQISDYTHVIILQVPLGEDEFQDVATIEIEKTGDEDYNMQVHGNEVLYGVDYYVSPVYVHIYRWPIIPWIFRPVYRPYWSVFYFGYYPRWWNPYRPVAVPVYRTRTVRYTRRGTFEMTRVSRVKTVHKVNYKPRTSDLVKKNVKVVHPTPEPKATPIITKPTRLREKTPVVKKDMETPNKEAVETTVKAGAQKTDKPKVEKNITGKSRVKNRTKSDIKKSTTFKSEVKKTPKPKVRKTTPVKSGINKTTKPKVEKRATVKREVKKTTRPTMKKSTTARSEVKKTTKPKVEKKTTVEKDNKKTTDKKKK